MPFLTLLFAIGMSSATGKSQSVLKNFPSADHKSIFLGNLPHGTVKENGLWTELSKIYLSSGDGSSDVYKDGSPNNFTVPSKDTKTSCEVA